MKNIKRTNEDRISRYIKERESTKEFIKELITNNMICCNKIRKSYMQVFLTGTVLETAIIR